ncbi:CHAD domain-containing protein [Deinococcus sp. Arct2-2]|uniref:CHAD domain-containing protein n=1 Tax=Deinococcus sp. Arct2-2 TaxID=2568653 RepID=UPI0010A4E091|nr:CHAD domain-containing protein [Deinococcus sp. Arct2-2]THF71400.1 CHAD domain-containing protein [Deinococcus sp. Arct2-2]
MAAPSDPQAEPKRKKSGPNKTSSKKTSSKKTPSERLNKLLPAVKDGDPKAIHEARKLTRKVAAELALTDAPKKVRRAWRDLRRAVAPVRDRDAAGEHVRAALHELNASAAEIATFDRDWQSKRAEALAAMKLPKLSKDVPRPKHFKRKVRAALAQQSAEILEAAPKVLRARTTETWHEWRKTLKHYRYTLELLEPAPSALTDVLDGLGRLQDAEVVLDILTGEARLPHSKAALIQREKGARQEAQRQVRQAWPALEAVLQSRLLPEKISN